MANQAEPPTSAISTSEALAKGGGMRRTQVVGEGQGQWGESQAGVPRTPQRRAASLACNAGRRANCDPVSLSVPTAYRTYRL